MTRLFGDWQNWRPRRPSEKNMKGVWYEDDPEALKPELGKRIFGYVSFLNMMVEPVDIMPVNRHRKDQK